MGRGRRLHQETGMAVQRGLDRRARTALIIAALVFLALPILAVRSLVFSIDDEGPVAAAGKDSDELVVIGRRTMYLEHGSLGGKIAKWLNAGGKGSRAFEIREQTFVPGSAEPSDEGRTRLHRLAHLLQDDHTLKARILVSDRASGNPQLARQRAERLRGEVLKLGVSEDQIKSVVTSVGKGPPMVIVMSKSA